MRDGPIGAAHGQADVMNDQAPKASPMLQDDSKSMGMTLTKMGSLPWMTR